MTVDNISRVCGKYVDSTRDCSLGVTEQFVLLGSFSTCAHHVLKTNHHSLYFGLVDEKINMSEQDTFVMLGIRSQLLTTNDLSQG